MVKAARVAHRIIITRTINALVCLTNVNGRAGTNLPGIRAL